MLIIYIENEVAIYYICVKFKFIILLLFDYIFFFIIIIVTIRYKKKICICTLGKQENKYTREFIQFYEKFGVDKIFLYDNNYEDGERFDEVIGDYIDKGFVEIINWRGKKLLQLSSMNDCYKKNYKNYDWLIFYDIDEYINLSGYSNIKYFLNEGRFSECQLIYLNLIPHTDNNHLYYENRSLFKRFPERVPITKPEGKKLEVKFIIKGNISKVRIRNQHYCNHKLKNCNGFGKKNTIHYIHTNYPDYNYYYIDHFFSKSTEELIDKIKKGDCRYHHSQRKKKLGRYFNQSDVSKEKIDLIEKRLKIKIKKYVKLKNFFLI